MTDAAAHSLDELAVVLGITRHYHDGMGTPRRASDDAVLAVVRSLGVALDRIDDAPDALAALRGGPANPCPVLCATSGERSFVHPGLPGSGRLQARLRLESGESMELAAADSGHEGAAIEVPPSLPAGYHHLEVDDASTHHEALLLVAPAVLPRAPRGWALFAPLYGLGAGGDGFATYGDLVRLADWMTKDAGDADRDMAFVGTLPLLACYLEGPFEPSPYSPISRAFWSELYVDPCAAPEWRETRGRGDAEARAAAADRIDYRGAMRSRRAAIEALLHALDANGGGRRDALDAAIDDDQDELARYAAFRAAVERHGTTWQEWPERARAGTLRAGADYDGESFRYHAYAQWLAREQVAAAAGASRAGLYLDLPLGSHAGGYDTWRHAAEFAHGISTGAPPDAVFEGGQDWGFPPLHPERARAGGYAALRAALRHHFAHASVLRVDHVMGLHRLFWVPDGFTAADGVYVRSYARELWGVLAIEASRGRGGAGSAVVGEDLGTVPDEVRREMAARGALRMHVVPFECSGDHHAALEPPPRDSLAGLGTHDMEPFASWWKEETTPRHAIASFLGCDEDAASALAALVAWLGRSDATLVCANLEDLWLEPRRQNLPGTTADYGNWQRPFARRFGDFSKDARLRALIDLLRGAAPEAPAQFAEASR